MELKQALCLRAESYLSFVSDSIREWNKATQELLELQKEWDAVGSLPREVAKEINKQFWSTFKQFFNNKNRFFEQLDNARTENLRQKEALCAQAEALQESSDWEAGTEQLKELQAQWKKIGPVPEKQKDAIYERFKAACDKFFDRKRNRRNEEDRSYEANLRKKEDICAKIFKMAQEKTGTLQDLQQLKAEFVGVGFVPREAMSKISDKFGEAVETFVATLGLPVEEAEQKALEIIMEVSQGGDKRVGRKKQNLRNQISALENDIALLENNMAFFSRSKNADGLIKEFSDRLKGSQEKLAKLRKQLQVINNIGGE
jgi:hypothetical protein